MKRATGLVGIGLAGAALAERLLAAGHDVIGFDIDPERCELLKRLGGMVVDEAAEVVVDARYVLLALVQPAVTVEVVQTIASHLQAGDIVIDVGTGDPQETERLARTIRARGAELIDAPLSGSSDQIRNGEAIAMLGGEPGAIADAAWLWPLIAQRHVHLGAVGNGQRAKLATNLVLGLNRAALAEGLAFAEALGLDPSAFVDLLRITPAYSRAVDVKGARMLARDYEPESRIAQHRKDVGLMLDAARSAGIALPLSTAHATQLDAAIAHGLGERDNAAIVEVWRRDRDGRRVGADHALREARCIERTRTA